MALFFSKARRGAGNHRTALRQLMEMDAARLNDIGLTHFDVMDALRHGASAGLLDQRRNARALEWLR